MLQGFETKIRPHCREADRLALGYRLRLYVTDTNSALCGGSLGILPRAGVEVRLVRYAQPGTDGNNRLRPPANKCVDLRTCHLRKIIKSLQL